MILFYNKNRGFILPTALFSMLLSTLCFLAIFRHANLQRKAALTKLKQEHVVLSTINSLSLNLLNEESSNLNSTKNLFITPTPFRDILVHTGNSETKFYKHKSDLFLTTAKKVASPIWGTILSNLTLITCNEENVSTKFEPFESSKNCQLSKIKLESSAAFKGNLKISGELELNGDFITLAITGELGINTLKLTEKTKKQLEVIALGNIEINSLEFLPNNSGSLLIKSTTGRITLGASNPWLNSCKKEFKIDLQAPEGIFSKSNNQISSDCVYYDSNQKIKFIGHNLY